MIPAYAAPARALACSIAQINAFVLHCTSASGSTTACNSWETNTANSACFTCIAQGPRNSGAVLFDSTGAPFELNLGGCVALADPTNGPACGMAVDPLLQCEYAACNSAACLQATASVVDDCITASDQGACASLLTAANSACVIDFGDGGVGNTTCATSAGVIAEICGNGM
jgi:hypothetical protein